FLLETREPFFLLGEAALDRLNIFPTTMYVVITPIMCENFSYNNCTSSFNTNTCFFFTNVNILNSLICGFRYLDVSWNPCTLHWSSYIYRISPLLFVIKILGNNLQNPKHIFSFQQLLRYLGHY